MAALQRDCDAAGRLRAQLGALAAGAAEQTRAELAPAVRGAGVASPRTAPAAHPAAASADAAGERGSAAGLGGGAAAGGGAAGSDAPGARTGGAASAACTWTGAGAAELRDGGGGGAADDEEAALMRALQGALAQRVRGPCARALLAREGTVLHNTACPGEVCTSRSLAQAAAAAAWPQQSRVGSQVL